MSKQLNESGNCKSFVYVDGIAKASCCVARRKVLRASRAERFSRMMWELTADEWALRIAAARIGAGTNTSDAVASEVEQ